jgi:hypothetical protein
MVKAWVQRQAYKLPSIHLQIQLLPVRCLVYMMINVAAEEIVKKRLG